MRKLLFFLLLFAIISSFSSVNAGDYYSDTSYGGSTSPFLLRRPNPKEFYFSGDFRVGNAWSNVIAYLPLDIINWSSGGSGCIGLGGLIPLSAQWIEIEKDGQEIEVDYGNYYGFKAKDFFRSFEANLRFGWQPNLSFIGIYASLGYQFNKLKMKPDDMWLKYTLNYLKPGMGIRIILFPSKMRQGYWSPILEFGTSYNYILKGFGPKLYNDDREQFNSGLSNEVAAGFRVFGFAAAITGYWDNFDFFNQDYVKNGIKPYQGITTKHYGIGLRMYFEF